MDGVKLIQAIDDLKPDDRLIVDLLIARLQAPDQVFDHLQIFVRKFGKPRGQLVDFGIDPDTLDNQ